MTVDVLIIDDKIIGEYHSNHGIYVYRDRIILLNRQDNSEVLNISNDGSIQFLFNKFQSNTSTHIPGLKIYTDNTDQSKANNIELYNNAIQWREDYISYKGLSDTGQGINMMVDALMIDNIIIDKYDGNYKYYIDIYNDHIILLNNHLEEILTISSDGLVTITGKIPNY